MEDIEYKDIIIGDGACFWRALSRKLLKSEHQFPVSANFAATDIEDHISNIFEYVDDSLIQAAVDLFKLELFVMSLLFDLLKIFFRRSFGLVPSGQEEYQWSQRNC